MENVNTAGNSTSITFTLPAMSEEDIKKLSLADRNARKLLLKIIGRRAYMQFKRRNYLEMVAPSGKRYRLIPAGGIREMAGNFGDKTTARLCIHAESKYYLPAVDNMIIQMMLLQTEEGEALLQQTAHRTAVAA